MQKLLAYGGEMQHSNENVYESQAHSSSAGGLQMSPAAAGNTNNQVVVAATPQQQQQSNYLSSSPHVQQPLPASTMASSVAALQRLSASIDVTVSRSNSRASGYEDSSNKEASETIEAAASQPLVPTVITGLGPGEPEDEQHGSPHYLKENCVVYSFYSGDLKTAIEDHFTRSLPELQGRGSDSPSHSESSGNLQHHRGKCLEKDAKNVCCVFILKYFALQIRQFL